MKRDNVSKYNIFIGTYMHLCLQIMNDLLWAQRINGMRFLNLGSCSSILSWYLRKYRDKLWSNSHGSIPNASSRIICSASDVKKRQNAQC